MSYEERYRALIEKVRSDIERVGWSSISVFATEDDPSTFTYTIGLTETYDHPELIVYGLSAEQSYFILLNAIALIKKGVRLEPQNRYAEVLEGFDVGVRMVEQPVYPLNMARAVYDDEVEAVQILWPDKQGRFPDDPDADMAVLFAQLPQKKED